MLAFGGVYHTTQKSGFRSQYQGPAGRSLDVAAAQYIRWPNATETNHWNPNSSGWWQLKYFCYFHPNPWGNDPKWRAYFSNGLVQPPTSKSCFWRFHVHFLTGHLSWKSNPGGIFFWVFPKIGVPPKWMVYNGKPYEQMDDLGGNPHYFRKHPS